MKSVSIQPVKLIAGFLLVLLVCFAGFPINDVRAEPKQLQANASAAGADRFELEQIVVTAGRTEEPANKIPQNVTVITEADIAQAPGNNVVDLLSREAGVELRSSFGSDKHSVVDIRGMGATAPSSVIVMVDGIKQNLPDLSGADFSTIPLEQIKRIEIVRGAGSVMYGNGAVGGVINIVTKKGRPETAAGAYISYGSFDTLDTRASLSGGHKDFCYGLNGAYYDSDGYRDNGGLEKKDIAGNIGYTPCDWLSLNLSGSFHADEYGLPGPVGKDDLNSRKNRIKTDYPDDYGETWDNRLSAGADIDYEPMGHIHAVRGYRFLNNDYVIGYSPRISRGDQVNHIDGFIKSLNFLYEKNYSLYGRAHKFQFGLDHYYTDYVREEAPGGPRKNSRVGDLGVFLNNHCSLAPKLLLRCGFRENRYSGRYRTDLIVSLKGEKYWVNGVEMDRTWYNNAYNVGLTYLFSPDISGFAGYSTSFRTPNVDEMAEAEDGLKPQKGVHLDAGGRVRVADILEASVTFFHIAINDEIYYSEVNRNYKDRTVRRGVETDVKLYPADPLFVWANYSFTDARFDKTGKQVPLVPQHKASIGIEWDVLHGLMLAMTGTYVGSSYDGNDLENNRYDKLDAYGVFDTKLSYQYKGFKLFAGVNNMFDKMYSTLSYSEAYYPMPGRSFYGGLAWVY